MRVAWILLMASLRQTWKRLVLIAGAIAMGVAMLMAFTAAFNALTHTSDHSAWQLAVRQQQANQKTAVAPAGVDPLYVVLKPNTTLDLNKWRNQDIQVVSFYAGGPKLAQLGPLPPPKDGEYYVSPALEQIMREHPEDNIGQRFGTKQLGTIPSKYVATRDALLVIRGMSQAEAEASAAQPVYTFTPTGGTQEFISGLMTRVLYLGVFVLLFPIVLLISIATQLGSAQREQRYAALRLIGATRSQIMQIISLESMAAAIAGIALGILAYLAARPSLAEFRFGGERFWPQDIAVMPVQYLIIVTGTILLTLLANWWGMRHVQISPLGIARRQKTLQSPRWWRILPLLLGLGIVGYARLTTEDDSASSATILIVLAGVVLISIGLVVIGPWLTQRLAQMVGRRTKRPVILLGTRYIEVHARQVFRSVSGVVLALFASSFYLTTVSGIEDYSARFMSNGYSQLKPAHGLIMSDRFENNFADKLKAQPFIHDVATVEQIAGAVTVIPCETALIYTTITCSPGARLVGVNLDALPTDPRYYGQTRADIARQLIEHLHADPASATTPAVQYLVHFDNSALDQLRSLVAVETAPLLMGNSYVASGSNTQNPVPDTMIRDLAGLAYAGIVVTMLVAIVSLAVSTVGGLLERRRSLTTLRLGGMEPGQLKRLVVVESLIPLVVTSLVAAGVGVGIGYVFMELVSVSLDAKLSPMYLAVVAGSLVAATMTIYLTLPMIQDITSTEANRTE